MAIHDAVFHQTASKDYALARVCLALHITPQQAREMTVGDMDLILSTIAFEEEYRRRKST